MSKITHEEELLLWQSRLDKLDRNNKEYNLYAENIELKIENIKLNIHIKLYQKYIELGGINEEANEVWQQIKALESGLDVDI